MKQLGFYGRQQRSLIANMIEEEDLINHTTEELDVSELGSDVEIEVGEVEEVTDDESDEEIIPSDHPRSVTSTSEDQTRTIPWKLISGEESVREKPEWRGSLPTEVIVKDPIEYFKTFFDEDIMKHLVQQTNLYAIQVDSTKPVNLDNNELEQFFGTLLYMSMVKISKVRLYWSDKFDFNCISDIFSRNRWEKIKEMIHCNDNQNAPARNSPNYDPLYKIRPLLTHLKNKFSSIPKSQMLSVDEQIVPFKGVSALKQYLPSKPHKWGFKIFALCDSAGMLYDFEVYIGKIKPVENEPDLGASSNIVLRLVQSVPHHQNYLIYFDNWFTSVPLICTLAKKGMFALGTVRLNRVKGIGAKMTNDKDLMKKGRGSHCEFSGTVDGVELRVLKWADNSCMNLISSFSSAHPLGTCTRYDKKKKQVVDVCYPETVKKYNEFMGGVDLMDSLVSLYRIHIRSHKLYHKIIYHLLDVTVVNSWLLYRRDCNSAQVPLKDVLPLQDFKLSVANSLVLAGKVLHKRQGRPSLSVEFRQTEKRKWGNNTKPLPENAVRMDGFHHWPTYQKNQQRCKMPGCKSRARWECSKCKVTLCLTADNNCFSKFHNE